MHDDEQFEDYSQRQDELKWKRKEKNEQPWNYIYEQNGRNVKYGPTLWCKIQKRNTGPGKITLNCREKNIEQVTRNNWNEAGLWGQNQAKLKNHEWSEGCQ